MAAVTTPPAPPLIVPVDVIARRLGLPDPLTEDDEWLIAEAIADAQSDLEAHLGRPVTPREYTEMGRFPFAGGFRLAQDPVVEVVSTTAETDPGTGQPTGLFTVVYTAGLDGALDPDLAPLRRYVTAHTIYSAGVQAILRRLAPESAQRVRTVAVEGQSVTYEDVYARSAEAGAVGSLPTLKSCDRWRVAGRRVHQAATRMNRGGWPFA